MSPLRLGKLNLQANASALEVEARAIPEVLAAIDARYTSAHFGKWHIYEAPEQYGYAVSDGATDNRTGGFTGRKQTQHTAADDPKKMFEITERAIDFMREQVAAKRPFFLQVSHYAVHTDVEARSETLGRYAKAPPGRIHTSVGYAAMTEDLDDATGRLIEAVRTLGISDRTYVFYMSDNGALSRDLPGINAPLRGGKLMLYEGGIRVPLIVTGPRIEGGTHSDTPVIGWDLLPTFAELAGGVALGDTVDGGSLVGVLHGDGKAEVQRPHDALYFRFRVEGGAAVVLRDGIKLKKNLGRGADQLFDLNADLSELNNLAVLRAETTSELDALLQRWLDSAPSPSARPRAAPSTD
jgi:arylsulfatase A-like enzyme